MGTANLPNKLACYFIVGMFGSFLGAGLGFGVPMVGKEKLGLPIPGPDIAWAIVGAAIGIAAFGWGLRKVIFESGQRLAVPAYYETLLRLGIAKDMTRNGISGAARVGWLCIAIILVVPVVVAMRVAGL
jgi:hypothetical protein